MLQMLMDGTIDPLTDQYNLASISGIIMITFVIVEILKKYVSVKTPVIGKIPTWMVPIIIASGLALIANKVIVIDGQPILAGNGWVVLGRAILAAASSSGLFSMITSRNITLGESKPIGEDNTVLPE